MTSRSGISTANPPHSSAPLAANDRRPERPSPWTLLLVSAWVGLTAGFLDLGFMIVKRRLIDGEEFDRLGEGFPWIIPLGVAALVLLPGVMLALVARLRASRVPLGLAVVLFSFVGFLDLCALLPLDLWASLILSAGLAIQAARLVGRRRGGFLRLVRATCPILAGAVVILAVATSGVRAWHEHRASAHLPPPPPAARNVLLIVWDTVRARNLSLYGHGRKTTPNLERLAARGVHFRHAFATAPWTLPSHASLFTGRWPHELSAGWKTALDGTQPTLAGRLSALGYDTAGFVANLDYCGRACGLARGFTHYEDFPLSVWDVFTRHIGLGRRLDPITLAIIADILTGRSRGAARPLIQLHREHAKSAADIDRGFLDWLAWQRPRGRPFFAFLNLNDAHSPYEAPDDATEAFGVRPSSWREQVVLYQWNTLDKTKLPFHDVQMANDLYDDAIAYMDRRLGILLDELDRRGVLGETLVIVTSDHGEHLGDHLLFFHGCSLYRQAVEVPLVIVDPRAVPPGRVVDAPVSLRDLPATIVGQLGLDKADTFPGRSLARFWTEGEQAPWPSEPLLMETDKPELLTNQGREPAAKGPMKAVIAGGMHYIRSGDGSEELYSLAHDPEERSNVAGLAASGHSLEGFRAALRSMLRKRPSGDGRTASLAGEGRGAGAP
jgi:arylsulfatase A-like enzyme